MVSKKREAVSASFHYLTRVNKGAGPEAPPVPISEHEFDGICRAIEAKPTVNLDDASVRERVRYRLEVPMERPNRISPRAMFGVFRGAYSGHANDNSARGKIPADSISFRPFHYLLYHSESGRVYIGAQYLGLFGGYASLERTVRDLLPDPGSISAHSFRVSGSYYRDAQPTEVRVKFINDPKSSTGRPSFTKSGVVAFKKQSKTDGFETSVTEGVFPLIGMSEGDVKRGMAALLSQNDLIDVCDDDIENVTVFATVNGRRNTAIHMIDNGGFATRFPLDLEVNADGHPIYEDAQEAMISVLRSQIIARTEHG